MSSDQTEFSEGNALKKSFYEDFAHFFEVPSRVSLQSLLQYHTNETNRLDFKREWPNTPELAKDILGIANSRGGCIVIGVAEVAGGGLEAVGTPEVLDRTVITDRLFEILPRRLEYEPHTFPFKAADYPAIGDKTFQVIIIEDTPRYVPFMPSREKGFLKRTDVFVRRGTGTQRADYEELQSVINRKIETQFSTQIELDLAGQIEQLRSLYREIEPEELIDDEYMSNRPPDYMLADNQHYPRQSIDEFISLMIRYKKRRISDVLGVYEAYLNEERTLEQTPRWTPGEVIVTETDGQ